MERFASRINQEVSFVELSFDGTFTLDGAIQLHGEDDQIMWQKERMINLVVESLPDRYDKIAWVDGDIHFHDPDWFVKAEETLEDCDVVHLWSECRWLDKFENPKYILNSFMTQRGGHPGFAWAMQRRCFPLVDRCIVGGGDSAMSRAWRNPLFFHEGNNMPWRQYIYEEMERLGSYTIDYLDGVIDHFWHGPLGKRRYGKRVKDMSSLGYNPYRDIELAENGLWRWSKYANPGLKKYLYNYLKQRAAKTVL